MAVATDFLALLQDCYDRVDQAFTPLQNPTGAQIQQLFVRRALQFPLPIELTTGSLEGGLFRVSTEVTSLILNFEQLALTTGTVERFEVDYAADGQNYSRLFEILPRLGGELPFQVAEFIGISPTNRTIFGYFLNLLETADPAKAIQLDFPGGSAETAFDLGALGQAGLAALGQVFDLPANEDQDYYSFSIDKGSVRVTLDAGEMVVGAGNVTLSLWQGATRLAEQKLVGANGGLQMNDLDAGDYVLAIDADAGSNVEYLLQISTLPVVTVEAPLVMDATATQLLYVSYYGRPADAKNDVDGFHFWHSTMRDAGFSYSPRQGDTLTPEEKPLYERIVDDFGAGPEYEALFIGKDNTQKMDAIYQYCFNRNSEQSLTDEVTGEQYNYWVRKLDRSEITLSQAAVEVALGAQGSDLTFLSNRLQSANVFFQQLDTTEERTAYAGEAAGTLARTWLQSFGASVATTAEADAVILQIVGAATPPL